MAYTECVACSGELRPWAGVPGVSVCRECGGVHGEVPRGRAERIVALYAPMQGEAPMDRVRYFDFTFTDAGYRAHGWYDSVTGNVVQYG